MFNFNQLKKNISSLDGELKSLRSSISKKSDELNMLNTSPIPYGDYLSMWDSFIDDQARQGTDNMAPYIERFIASPGSTPGYGHDFFMGAGSGGTPPPGVVPLFNFYALFSDVLKKRLREIFPPDKYPKNVGLPLSERPKIAKKLEVEIEKLTSKETELTTYIAQVGMLS